MYEQPVTVNSKILFKSQMVLNSNEHKYYKSQQYKLPTITK